MPERRTSVCTRGYVFNNVEGGTTPGRWAMVATSSPDKNRNCIFTEGRLQTRAKPPSSPPLPFLFHTHFFFFRLFSISSYVSSFIPFLYSPFFFFSSCLFLTLFSNTPFLLLVPFAFSCLRGLYSPRINLKDSKANPIVFKTLKIFLKFLYLIDCTRLFLFPI